MLAAREIPNGPAGWPLAGGLRRDAVRRAAVSGCQPTPGWRAAQTQEVLAAADAAGLDVDDHGAFDQAGVARDPGPVCIQRFAIRAHASHRVRVRPRQRRAARMPYDGGRFPSPTAEPR